MQSIVRLLLCLAVACGTAAAQTAPARVKAQMLYLPVYSHVYHGDLDSKGAPVRSLVSVLVSIRNTDPARPIRVMSAQYYDTDGKKLKEYVTAPKLIGPMGTHEVYIPTSDTSGGSGANFVVSWQADTPVNPPIVEGLHLNLTSMGRSIAFMTQAREISAQ